MQTLLSSPPKPPLRLGKFLSSVVAHLALLCTAVVLSRYVVSDGDEIDWSRFRVEPLRLHESVPVIFVQNTERAARVAGHTIPAPAAGKAGPTVLEPDYRPEARLPKSVPPLTHWSRMPPPELPKPDVRSILTPGTAEAPPPELRLTATPNLSVPNRETTAGPVNISVPPAATSPRTDATLDRSSTQPLKTADSAPTPAASFDLSTGQPVNILALSEDRSRRQFVEIDRGLQNLSGSNAAEGKGSSSRELVPANDQNSATRQGAPAPSAARPTIHSDGAAFGLELVKPLLSSLSARIPPTELKRVNHPVNGSYDVVVAQASAAQDSAAGASGGVGAVYTVYLGVGDEKEWMLEFRGAASPRTPQNSVHVTVTDDDAITPPYPIVTVIPNKLLAALPTRLVLDGSITTAGVLRNLRVAGPASEIGQRLLELLEDWRFRPAIQNRTPVEVAVRLVVPPRS